MIPLVSAHVISKKIGTPQVQGDQGKDNKEDGHLEERSPRRHGGGRGGGGFCREGRSPSG